MAALDSDGGRLGNVQVVGRPQQQLIRAREGVDVGQVGGLRVVEAWAHGHRCRGRRDGQVGPFVAVCRVGRRLGVQGAGDLRAEGGHRGCGGVLARLARDEQLEACALRVPPCLGVGRGDLDGEREGARPALGHGLEQVVGEGIVVVEHVVGGAGPALDVAGCVGDELRGVAGVEGREDGVEDVPVGVAGDGAPEGVGEGLEGLLGRG